MIGDMPSISNASHSHTAYGLGARDFGGTTTLAMPPFTLSDSHPAGLVSSPHMLAQAQNFQPQQENIMAPAARRLVQVFIADPDLNVPLEQSMLYSGDQKLTDATDQELYFEIDMKSILDKHNEVRTKIINKKVKERTEYLEPVKIRDLKMVVVNVAAF